jgi:putative ABC transport system permease protein
MRTQLPWHNLVHNKVRTAVAVAGVAFAVVLIFMQLGFRGAVETTVTQIYDALDFDLLIRSRGYLRLSYPRTFPRDRLYQAASVPGVQNVAPLYIEVNAWRRPTPPYSKRGILTMGIQPENCAFSLPEIERKSHLLTNQEYALIDRKSRRDFGPRNGKRFSDADIGQEAEVADRRVRIVDHFELGTGLAADGAILLNVEGFCRLLPGRTPDEVSLGLVTVDHGVDPQTVAARLEEALNTIVAGEPVSDVDVLTRSEVIQYELRRWIRETAIGVIFQTGVVVALLVGAAIVYQVLSSDVANHLPEYATLKAMGYTNRYLCGVVLKQAVMLALFGFVPGLIFAEVLYRWTSYWSNIPIMMDGERIVWVLGLTVVMCTVSGLAASRKMNSVDPAELF